MEANNYVEAVRRLRKKLGDTQQSFAARLGLSISAVVNYERDRKPTGKALAALAKAADTAGEVELAKLFADALSAELGVWDTSEFESVYAAPRTEEEKLLVAALLRARRMPKYAEELARLVEILRPLAEVCISLLADTKRGRRQLEEIDRLLDRGLDPASVAKALEMPEHEDAIHNRANWRKISELAEAAKGKASE